MDLSIESLVENLAPDGASSTDEPLDGINVTDTSTHVGAQASKSGGGGADNTASNGRRRLKQQEQELVGAPLTVWRNVGTAGSAMDAVVHTAVGGTALLFDSPDTEPFVQLFSAYMSFGSASSSINWGTADGKGWSIMAYARAPPSSTASSERLFEFSGGGELANAISFGRSGTSSSGEYAVYGPGGSSDVLLHTEVPSLWNNEWRLMIATTSNSSYTVVVDGELVASGPTSALVGSRTTSLNYIGRSSAAGVPYTSSLQFRELKFWMVPLDIEDIDYLQEFAATQWGATVSGVPLEEQLREAARGAPQAPRAAPTAAPQGSPPAAPRGSPPAAPRGSPPAAPRGSPPAAPRGSPPAAPRGSPPALALRAPQPQPLPAATPPALSPPRLLPLIKMLPAAKAPPVDAAKQIGKGPPLGQGTNRKAAPSSSPGKAAPSSSPAAATNASSANAAATNASRAVGQGRQQQGQARGTPAAGYVSGLYISPEIRASAAYKVRVDIGCVVLCNNIITCFRHHMKRSAGACSNPAVLLCAGPCCRPRK
jgi:hypothetical protein